LLALFVQLCLGSLKVLLDLRKPFLNLIVAVFLLPGLGFEEFLFSVSAQDSRPAVVFQQGMQHKHETIVLRQSLTLYFLY
jgi:hypothetical protein